MATISKNYRPTIKEKFMNSKMKEYFRLKLVNWKKDLLKESSQTIKKLQKEENSPKPDLTDRATEEIERSFELRTRDRERKLINKINDALIDNAINSAFWNGGQNCSANMRQIIHSKIKDEFLDKVSKRIKNIKVGDPLSTDSNMGSMISKGHLAKVDGYILKGIDEGAKMLLGGVSETNQKGFFAKPTLFDNVKENMTIAQEEIFGPVLGDMTVNNENEALNIAKNSKYGLHASVFTQDINKAFHLAKSLPCGTVSVNTFSEGDIKVPFGGYKQSGSLSRDQGTEALNQYLQTKTIWISHS